MHRFNFFYELKKQFKMLVNKTQISTNIVLVNFSKLYIEGPLEVLKTSEEFIELKLRKQELRVEGNKLEIVELSDSSLYVSGEIKGVSKVER